MNWVPRHAVPDDVDELVRLRALMFAAMGEEPVHGSWREPCVDYFRLALTTDRMVCFVIDAPDGPGLACCAFAEIITKAPRPNNPTGVVGHLSNVCTEPRWRRRGMSRAVVRRLLDELDGRGVPTATLHATREARPLYESLGFHPSSGGVEFKRPGRSPVSTAALA